MVPQPCRIRIGVVIVVPALAHREQPKSWKIISLNRMARDVPTTDAVIVGKEPDEPMTSQLRGNAAGDTHGNVAPSADPKQDYRERELLQHPCPLQESKERIVQAPGLDRELRRMG